MSFEHENHLLLWLLEEPGELNANLISQFIELLVFFLDEVNELTDLFLEVVEALTDKDSLLKLIQ